MFSKTLLLLLVVYFLSDVSHGQRDKKFFRDDYHYIEATDSFYKIHGSKQNNWHQAKRLCALEGASLFYAENEEEAKAVISFWNTTQPQVPSINVGLHDIETEGIFETIDGKLISEVYNNWLQGEPNNSGDEDCVDMFRNGDLNDWPCTYGSAFICKKSLQTVQWNSQCNMSNLDYTLATNISKCYKVHTTPLNWDEAYATCRAEQSSLAIVNDQEELDYLAKLSDAAPKRKIAANYQKGIFHLGFHNKYDEGWQTVKGSPMTNDRLWWGNEQPDLDDGKKCGSMFYTGLLSNVNCDTKSFFICEHELNSSDENEEEYY
ncbi:hypothetical protein PYW07_003776 [Mythimna separata]|uniref:IML13 n=1 Tax=Mythimna separata TaxID=271217 RepID=A0A8F3C7B9_MYTSE|nr:hypothetical protein PYW07_003776 [Mythimna separata]QWY13110.1 IML13 [Mythimna separata]